MPAVLSACITARMIVAIFICSFTLAAASPTLQLCPGAGKGIDFRKKERRNTNMQIKSSINIEKKGRMTGS